MIRNAFGTVLHHLVIPRAVVGLVPGEPIYFSRDGIGAGVTYMGSDGFAFALLPAGPLVVTLGDKRNAPTVEVEMANRDCMLHADGRVSRVTPYWADLLTIRTMSHEQRVELAEWERAAGLR